MWKSTSRRSLCGLVQIIAALLTGQTVTATTLFVRWDCGDDSWNGLSNICTNGVFSAKKTIQGAINAAAAGDRIEVLPGTYQERIDLQGKNLQIVPHTALGTGPVIIDGQGSGPVIACDNGEGPSTILMGLTAVGGSAPAGAGMYNVNSSPTIIDCIFTGNTATDPSGSGGGGGMFNSNAHPTVRNCIFYKNNSPGEGGGMFNTNGAAPLVVNCLFYDNEAPFGAGIRNFYGSSPTFINCTVADNAGPGMLNISNVPLLTNCILYGNTGGDIVNQVGANPVVTYSNVGGAGSYPGTGNLNADPRFVDAANKDYGLHPASLCVDAGRNAAVPAGISTDLAGAPRFVEDPCVVDTGNGTPPIVDMGARELQSHPLLTPIHVPGDYATIQSAIDHACDGATIVIEPGVYVENLSITKDLTLQGSIDAPAIINGNRSGRVISTGAAVDLTLIDVVLEGGLAPSGAAIANAGTLSMDRCTLAGNESAGDGGAILNLGTMSLTNCTVSGNQAAFSGGGVYNQATATLTNCTIAHNTAGERGGGIRNDGSLSLRGTIIAGNTAPISGPDVHGPVTSLSHNLVGDGSGSSGLAGSGDQVGTGGSAIDPMLDPLSFGLPTAPTFPGILAANTTGQPDGSYFGAPDDVYAGMGNGSVTFDFGSNRLVLDEAGPDFNVYEIDFGIVEFSLIDVLVSYDGVHFASVKSSEGPVRRISGDAMHGDDNYARSYDLAAAGASAVRYVRINATLITGDGFDLDAVGAIHAGTGPLPARLHRLRAGSPAIDAADPAAFPVTDQRGAPRPADSQGNGTLLPDAGAFEMDAYPLTVTVVSVDDACPGESNGSATVQVVGGAGVVGGLEPPAYCIPPDPTWAPCDASSRINSVVVSGGINSLTNSCSPGSYQHFNQTATWPAGSNQTINVNIGAEGFTSKTVGMWIDWNGDGDFDDAAEFLYGTGGISTSRIASIAVPTGIRTVLTRLRIKARLYDPFTEGDACTTDLSQGGLYQETEDYNVMITGGENYQYAWSNGATSDQLIDVPAGDYSVTVTDGSGTTALLELTVPESPSMMVTAGADTNVCSGESLILGGEPTAVGGTPPLTYLWSVNGQPIDQPVVDVAQPDATDVTSQIRPWQTFTATQSAELRAIEAHLGSNGGFPAMLQIYSGQFVTLLSSTPITVGSGWQRFELACPVPLTAGAFYTFSFEGLGTQVSFRYHTGNPYGGGSTWHFQYDLAFRTYVGAFRGLCSLTEANPQIHPIVTNTYAVTVTDGKGCTATSDPVTITVRDENPCLKLASIVTAEPRPHILGEQVAVNVNLSTGAPPNGMEIAVTGDNFTAFSLNVAPGTTTASRNVFMDALGYGFTARAQIVGFGGFVTTSLDVLPLVQSVTLDGSSPYDAGDVVTVTVQLRENAIAGGARVVVDSNGFDAVTVMIPEGSNTGQGQVIMNLPGSGHVATATASQGCARSAQTPPFDVNAGGPIYVNAATGDDVNNDGLSSGSPFATIGRAIDVAIDGYIILIAAGTYPESLVILENLTLQGAGADQTIVDADNNGRPLSIGTGFDQFDPVVNVSGMTFTRGSGTGGDAPGLGGGVLVDTGVVSMTDCAVTDSNASFLGGGVCVLSPYSFSMSRCTISGNSSVFDGGGFIDNGSTIVTLTNCTISGNAAGSGRAGGGAMIFGNTFGVHSTVDYCTITQNSANEGAGIYVSNSDGVRVSNTILAGNITPFGSIDCSGGFVSGGHNLIGGDANCFVSGDTTGNIVGAPAELAPLTDNGGPTMTHALLASSPAIDAASPDSYPPTDQRGVARPIDAGSDGTVRPDIGAYETDLAPQVSTMQFHPPAGTYVGEQSIVISTATTGAAIHYTIDGTDPTTSSTLYTAPVGIDRSLTIKARAFKEGYLDGPIVAVAYTLRVATPDFYNFPGVPYYAPFDLALLCATPNAEIRYTTDGSEPTELSSLYTSLISLTSSTTVKTRAFRPPLDPSEVNTGAYAFHVYPLTFTPDGGSYLAQQSVTITSSATPNVVIHYTLDGTDPDENSPVYTGPVQISTSTTLKAIGLKAGHQASPIKSAFYRLPIVIYVSVNGKDANDGLTWKTAKRTVQAGIDTAQLFDEVWVQEGTYKPTDTTDRTISIALKNGVNVYGGFKGTETDRSDQRSADHPTILDGDIGIAGDPADNSYAVVFAAGGVAARLDGFVVTRGTANGADPYYGGGGLRLNGGNVTVVNCRFRNNHGQFGGAVTVLSGTFNAVNSIFHHNSSQEGGALENLVGSCGFRNCTFYGNTASFHGSAFVTRNPGVGLFIANSIVWGHSGLVLSLAGQAGVTIRYNCWQDNFGNSTHIFGDPRFVDAANGDFRLLPDSSCIDAGSNGDGPGDITIDYTANPRYHNVLCLPDRGVGAAPVIDVGAYEFQDQLLSGPVPADYDHDCDVDAADLDLFIPCNIGPTIPIDPGCEGMDLDGDGDSDQEDFAFYQRCFTGEGNLGDPGCGQ